MEELCFGFLVFQVILSLCDGMGYGRNTLEGGLTPLTMNLHKIFIFKNIFIKKISLIFLDLVKYWKMEKDQL